MPNQKRVSCGFQRALPIVDGRPTAPSWRVGGDRFQTFARHPSDELVFDKSFLGVDRHNVVFIQIVLVRRQTQEAKLAFYDDVGSAPCGPGRSATMRYGVADPDLTSAGSRTFSR